MSMPLRLLAAAVILCLGLASPAQAAVTITFWSHELGNSFPHAFITLRGVPDAGGPATDQDYGFTAKSVSPAILFGSVPGRVEPSKAPYIAASDAQFSVVLTDAQYGRVRVLIAAWSEGTGDSRYNLNNRNCIHFVKEAARIAGLAGIDQPTLMKKPRSYLLAVEAANPGRVVPVNAKGAAYLPTLPPIAAVPAPTDHRPTAPAPISPVPSLTPPSTPHPPTGSRPLSSAPRRGTGTASAPPPPRA